MEKEKSIKKVNTLCKNVLKLTEEDFEAIEEMANEQSGYVHPLKHGKQEKLNETGSHNHRVIAALKNLRQVLNEGAPKG